MRALSPFQRTYTIVQVKHPVSLFRIQRAVVFYVLKPVLTHSSNRLQGLISVIFVKMASQRPALQQTIPNQHPGRAKITSNVATAR